MTIIASEIAALLCHRLGRTLAISALAVGLISTAAGPALAEGDYVAGPTASPAWTESTSRTPLAAPAPAGMSELLGGDDQYVAGPTALRAWPRGEDRTPLAGPGTNRANFDLASQGS
jgi:hypothetical protein